MSDELRIMFKILFIIAIGAVPLWLTTRKMKREFRSRYGRKPTERELTSITAWMQTPTLREKPDSPDRKTPSER